MVEARSTTHLRGNVVRLLDEPRRRLCGPSRSKGIRGLLLLLLLGKGHGLSLMSLELLSGKEILRLPLEEHSLRLLLRLQHRAECVCV